MFNLNVNTNFWYWFQKKNKEEKQKNKSYKKHKTCYWQKGLAQDFLIARATFFGQFQREFVWAFTSFASYFWGLLTIPNLLSNLTRFFDILIKARQIYCFPYLFGDLKTSYFGLYKIITKCQWFSKSYIYKINNKYQKKIK